jgi:hypothetical protein
VTTVLVTFDPDPELEVGHRRREYAPGRPGCSCGWYPAPTPEGKAASERAVLEHRRDASRRKVTIEGDLFLAWVDEFGTRQYVSEGPTGEAVTVALGGVIP